MGELNAANEITLHVLALLREGLTPLDMVTRQLVNMPLIELTKLCRTLNRQRTRDLITPHLASLIASQISAAKGISYLVYRDKKTGKFERVKNVEDVDQDAETIEVWQKDPSTLAFTDLMNRAIDKPQEHVELTGKDGEPIQVEVIARLAAARKRLSE